LNFISGDVLLALLALLTFDVVDLCLPFLVLVDFPGFTTLPDFFEVRGRLLSDGASLRISDVSACTDLTDLRDLRDLLDRVDLIDFVDTTDPLRPLEVGRVDSCLSVLVRFGKYFPVGLHADCVRAEKSMFARGLGYVYRSSGRIWVSNTPICSELLSLSSDEEMLGLDSPLKKIYTIYHISPSQC